MTEEKKLLLMMKGLLSESTPDERAAIETRIAEITKLVADDVGSIALAYVTAVKADELEKEGK